MNLKKLGLRVLVAIFGIPLILVLMFKGGWYFVALVLVINLRSQYEFYKLTELKQMFPFKMVGLVGTIVITISCYQWGLDRLWLILIPMFYITLLLELFRNKASATLNIAATTWGFFYPPIFFNFHILIRELPTTVNLPYELGWRWLLFMVLTIWICDTAAYFVGSTLGKHKLYHRISPHKTIEGAIAGFIFAMITAYIAHITFIPSLALIHSLLMGALIGIMSQIGDLVESLFKRDAGVKDTSEILPGHGGFLDRFDAPIFVAPLIYFYLRLIV